MRLVDGGWGRRGRSASGQQTAEGTSQVRPGGRGATDEPLLEAAVLLVAQAGVGGDGGRIVGPDVEHDLVTVPQQVRGDSARDGLGVAAAAVLDVGEDIAHDREAGVARDDVGAGRSDEAAVDPDAVVDALGDGARWNPRGEAQALEAVELADLDGEQALDA